MKILKTLMLLKLVKFVGIFAIAAFIFGGAGNLWAWIRGLFSTEYYALLATSNYYGITSNVTGFGNGWLFGGDGGGLGQWFTDPFGSILDLFGLGSGGRFSWIWGAIAIILVILLALAALYIISLIFSNFKNNKKD